MTGLGRLRRKVDRAWEGFFYAEAPTAPGGLFRIAYAILLLVNMGTLGLDLTLFYSEEGLLGRDASKAVLQPLSGSFLWWGPPSVGLLWTYYGIFMAQIALLGLGVILLLLGLIGQIESRVLSVGTDSASVRIIVSLVGLFFIGYALLSVTDNLPWDPPWIIKQQEFIGGASESHMVDPKGSR